MHDTENNTSEQINDKNIKGPVKTFSLKAVAKQGFVPHGAKVHVAAPQLGQQIGLHQHVNEVNKKPTNWLGQANRRATKIRPKAAFSAANAIA